MKGGIQGIKVRVTKIEITQENDIITVLKDIDGNYRSSQKNFVYAKVIEIREK